MLAGWSGRWKKRDRVSPVIPSRDFLDGARHTFSICRLNPCAIHLTDTCLALPFSCGDIWCAGNFCLSVFLIITLSTWSFDRRYHALYRNIVVVSHSFVVGWDYVCDAHPYRFSGWSSLATSTRSFPLDLILTCSSWPNPIEQVLNKVIYSLLIHLKKFWMFTEPVVVHVYCNAWSWSI